MLKDQTFYLTKEQIVDMLQNFYSWAGYKLNPSREDIEQWLMENYLITKRDK